MLRGGAATPASSGSLGAPAAHRFHYSTMKLLSAGAALLALSAPLGQHSLRFSPNADQQLTRTISWVLESDTDSSSTQLDGEPTSEVPNVKFSAKRSVELGVTDALEEVGDGRPLRFVRSYSDLLTEFTGNLVLEIGEDEIEMDFSGDGTSELEGLDVRFKWSEDEAAWGATWADVDHQGPDTLLESVAADMDLLALLTSDAVGIGDSWQVDLARLADVFFPGGDVGLKLETDLGQLEGALDPALLPGLDDVLRSGELEGDAVCTLKSIEGEVAIVELSLRVAGQASFVERVQGLVEAAAPEGIEADTTRAEYRSELEGTGTLKFALVKGHATSFEFTGPMREESELGVAVVADGEHVDFLQTHARSGTLTVRYTIE